MASRARSLALSPATLNEASDEASLHHHHLHTAPMHALCRLISPRAASMHLFIRSHGARCSLSPNRCDSDAEMEKCRVLRTCQDGSELAFACEFGIDSTIIESLVQDRSELQRSSEMNIASHRADITTCVFQHIDMHLGSRTGTRSRVCILMFAASPARPWKRSRPVVRDRVSLKNSESPQCLCNCQSSVGAYQ